MIVKLFGAGFESLKIQLLQKKGGIQNTQIIKNTNKSTNAYNAAHF